MEQSQQLVSQRLRSSSTPDMTDSLLSSFSDSSLCRSSLRSRHSSSHALVQERRWVLLSGRTSSVVTPGTLPVTTALVARISTGVLVLQDRVLLAHPVLHAQTTRAMVMAMSDVRDQIQLATPFVLRMSLLDLCGDR